MVKVLENSLVDLDVVPGKDEQQLQAQARQQAQALKSGGAYAFLFLIPHFDPSNNPCILSPRAQRASPTGHQKPPA